MSGMGVRYALFLRVPRIVRPVHIIDLPRTDAVKLNNRFTLRPTHVFLPGRGTENNFHSWLVLFAGQWHEKFQ